jgi:hypothetical protein
MCLFYLQGLSKAKPGLPDLGQQLQQRSARRGGVQREQSVLELELEHRPLANLSKYGTLTKCF